MKHVVNIQKHEKKVILRLSVSMNNSIKVLASSIGQSMYFTLTGIGIIYLTIVYVSRVSLAEPQ